MAAKKPVELEKHGDVRVDNYYWLRERDNPEVIEYLESSKSASSKR
jgi:oligopeptidase B